MWIYRIFQKNQIPIIATNAFCLENFWLWWQKERSFAYLYKGILLNICHILRNKKVRSRTFYLLHSCMSTRQDSKNCFLVCMTSSQIGSFWSPVHQIDKIEKKTFLTRKPKNFVTKKKLILWALCKNSD